MQMYRTLGILTLRNILKLHLFKFLLSIFKGILPVYHNALLTPLYSHHRYGTRRGTLRHPLITCEVQRKGIVHQLVLLYENIQIDTFSELSLAAAVSRFKKSLFEDQ